MTATAIWSATTLARSIEERKQNRAGRLRELDAMSEAMVDEEGLLNHSQAALILDVTPARVTELVNLSKLHRFDFLGRTYVSVKEVKARREEDLKAGRPRRTFAKRVSVAVKAVLGSDAAQNRHGGILPSERTKARVLKRRKT